MINLRRKYKMADGKLVETTIRVLVGAERDVAELTPFGWDQDRIDALRSSMLAFADLPTDGELSAMMAEKTEEKDLLRKRSTDYVMVQIMGRVSQRFDVESRTYERFRVGDIHSESDGNFYMTLKRVARQATDLQPQLVAEGLNQAIIDMVTQQADEFIAAMEAQDKAVDDRDLAVQARVEAGNLFYEELLKLGAIGKRIWLNVDESRYNDYVLYPNQSAGPGEQEPAEQQVVESEVAPMSVVSLSLTDLTPATQLTVENDGTARLTVYFGAMPTDHPPAGPDPSVISLNAGETWSGTAAALGLEIPGKEYLNVYNSDPTAGHLQVKAT
jgi:hypothetical protein